MAASPIPIVIKLFAVYQEAYGVPELAWEFPPHTPVSAVLDRMISEYPQLAPWQPLTRFGINLQFVEGDRILESGDEVVLIPPVSGG
ncbi:MAG: MoaD/ThiS family protein [Roseofilum sp. SBFL]|uniref:MoaD/ThiS family protein n=1 Tax=unclassified Roseofilum TaxID=2620099 RepID=UPI001B14110E|nr:MULTISPECIES: MoaD/ThiS family protein [unclassified Roseofilum]MBP0013475.1 MoaD/ThiS family protein [Roseofilum sp. SID3]MBP0024672.1 MoaD/ThiS family protein [Roseofilum sp. SID2]MBP0039480.1 MoaD/ThiS family protein [Roseofilum sp. SID1]MBP0042506.1 MoaD/ThiS family protein [Roseofilum sp. SBFL]